MPHVTALYNTVGTITPSYRRFFTLNFIPNPKLLLLLLLTSSIRCKLQTQVLKTIHFLYQFSFGRTYVQPPFKIREHAPQNLTLTYIHSESLSTFFFLILYQTR